MICRLPALEVARVAVLDANQKKSGMWTRLKATQVGFELSISSFKKASLHHGRLRDRVTGEYVLKNCVRDRKLVFVFSLLVMQYPITV